MDMKTENYVLQGEPNILIVDDRPENLMAAEKIIKPLHANIYKVESGEEALSLLMEIDFAVLLLDVQMPGMDGFEVATLIRGIKNTRTIPIIFMTALSRDEKFIFEGYEAGAVDYLFKPLEPVILQQKVQVFLELDRQKRELEKLVIEKSNLIKELDELSRIDPLTKLSNRRDILEKLNMEQAEYARYGKTFTIAMADIDFFKKINDSFGHDAGDYVLKSVASLTKDQLRNVDHLARWGGEEFLIILPETNLLGGAKVAEKIRSAIEQRNFQFRENKIKVSMSFGVSCHTGKGTDLDGLIKKADQLLYRAKESGRNTVVSM